MSRRNKGARGKPAPASSKQGGQGVVEKQWSNEAIKANGFIVSLLHCFIAHCSLLIASLFIVSPAFADEYHYNNILIGDRASGMGGAYTAISDDASGLYYNPAGIVYSGGGNLSASVNAYHITNTTYKGVLAGKYDYERQSSALVPNFFGIIQPLGNGVVGFSYAVPDSILENQDQTFYNLSSSVTKFVVNFNNKNYTYNFGPSYAMKLSENLSAGITLYVHYKEVEWISNQLINLNTGEYEWINQYYETIERGVRPLLGIIWTPQDKIAIGLSLSQTRVVDSKTTVQAIYKGITYDGKTVDRSSIESREKRETPLAAAAGIAYFATESLLLSGDFLYYAKTIDPNFGNREATWNLALGTEYYLSENWALRGGIFSNKANTPEIKAGDVNALDHVDLYGGTLSISRFTRQSSISLGGSYSFGSGKAQILGNDRIQDMSMQTSTFFLSASYSY
jgi:long-chain fatty acid transport protein